MKANPQSMQLLQKKMQQRPEIRDNLDSRKNEERSGKGNDITHNRKEKHSAKTKSK
ncbi:MAG: hypothetical protein IPJ81_15265 [Chitinophagaceae bacterium]|nr:hypothetical protein [Chitinophagaceae bacterium]